MKTSCVVTVLNEEKTIERFLDSVLSQTVLPTELVITDGGSSDKTVEMCKVQGARFKEKGIDLVVKSKKGNRSVGRNEAIRLAKNDIILISDAGCELETNWVKEITKPFAKKEVGVVAGYYKGKATTVFEMCLIPYVLVMPDRVDPTSFLPATRSMAIRKELFSRLGGFNTHFSHNEDYVFAHRLKDLGVSIQFQKSAIVYWYPRNTVKEAYRMFWRFAYGDAEAGIFRRKVLFIFFRYIVAVLLVAGFLKFQSPLLGLFILTSFLSYTLWTIQKNYRYIKAYQALYILPLLQFLSDTAVLSGTFWGVLHNMHFGKREYKMSS